MNFLHQDWRERRSFLNKGIPVSPMHYHIASYNTNADIHKNPDMKPFGEDIFTKIHTIPDPLKKNLADTLITAEKDNKMYSSVQDNDFFYEANITPPITEKIENNTSTRGVFYPSFTNITSFFSNVFGTISGVVFNRRSRSPVSQYYDCFDCDTHISQEMASQAWQQSNTADQNKNAQNQFSTTKDNMNDYRATVAQCEDKISAVKDLLKNKTVPQTSKNTKVRYRRPRKAFIEAGTVTEGYKDDVTADDYVSLPNDDYIEYFSIPNNKNQDCSEIEAPKMKIELNTAPESTDIVKVLPELNVVPEKDEVSSSNIINNTEPEIETKKEVIASCENKLAQLKAMLDKRKPKTNPNPLSIVETIENEFQRILTELEPIENIKGKPTIIVRENKQKTGKQSKVIPIDKKQDKRFKNPHRLTNKRRKTKLKKNIQEDMVFANEVDSEDISSIENSPAPVSMMQRIPERIPINVITSNKDYFDEVKGRFNSASTDSDDSFQIVFSESPKLSRIRRPSDCDSEDSFIVFEDTPDSCFTSNDLFGDDSESEESDDESEISDSGCANVCKMSPLLSRTVSDLTDDGLYDESRPLEDTSIVGELASDDEVDCAVRTIDAVVTKELSPVKEESPECEEIEDSNCGLLIDEAKKRKRKQQPAKKVSFSEKPPKVHVMRVWSFAARQARAGHWERYSLDRERFKRRIADVDMAISWVLKPQHRSRVVFQRFMPWWNKLKRQEAEERKKIEEEEKSRRDREEIIEEFYIKEENSIKEYENILFAFFKKFIEEFKIKKLKKEIELETKKREQMEKKKAAKRDRERRLAEVEKKHQEAEISAGNVSTSDGKVLWCR